MQRRLGSAGGQRRDPSPQRVLELMGWTGHARGTLQEMRTWHSGETMGLGVWRAGHSPTSETTLLSAVGHLRSSLWAIIFSRMTQEGLSRCS